MIQETEPITGKKKKKKKGGKKQQKKNRSQQGFKQEFRRASRKKIEGEGIGWK